VSGVGRSSPEDLAVQCASAEPVSSRPEFRRAAPGGPRRPEPNNAEIHPNARAMAGFVKASDHASELDKPTVLR